jgi:hypothetical protein
MVNHINDIKKWYFNAYWVTLHLELNSFGNRVRLVNTGSMTTSLLFPSELGRHYLPADFLWLPSEAWYILSLKLVYYGMLNRH